MVDKLTKAQRQKNMKAIRGKDTSIEVALRKRLWELGYRYRKNYSKLPGKPDIVFIKKKVVIFCDSEFWHGKGFMKERFEETENKEFWIKKIERNVERDISVNEQLADSGFYVLRFWSEEINKQPEKCIKRIIDALNER
jgi:DNA mismatch endonuclease, patch repair protein